MKRKTKHILFWLPRILCILFVIFLSLFAFDIFNEGYGVSETVLALLIHLIPVFIVTGVLVLTWRRQWIGALLFPVLALAYPVLTQGGQPLESLPGYFWSPGRAGVSVYAMLDVQGTITRR